MKRLLIFSILLALAVLTPPAYAQDLVLTDSAAFAGTGTFNVKGNIVDSAHAAKHITGNTKLVGTSTQYIGAASPAGASLAFDSLQAASLNIDSLGVPVTVNDSLALTLGTLVTAGKKLTISGSSSVGTGGLTSTGAADTVVYNGTSAQTVLGTNYNILRLRGAGAKNFGGTVNAARLRHTGGYLTVDQNVTVTDSAYIDTLATVASGKTLAVGSSPDTIKALLGNAGNVLGAGPLTFLHSVNNTSGNITGGAGKVTFDTLVQHSGGTIASGTGGITFNDTVVTAGPAVIIATQADTLNFVKGLHNKGTITLDSASIAMFGGNFSGPNTGTLNFGDASTVVYTGGAQAIYATHYGNLVSAGSADKTSDSITVKGSLKLTRNIAVNSGKVLTMTSTVPQNVSDTGEVRGTVARRATYTADTLYAFNRASVGLALKAHAGSDSIAVTMADATTPDSVDKASSHYVNRKYTIANANGADTLSKAQLYYADNELMNVPNESKLGIRAFNPTTATWSQLTAPGYTKINGTTGNEDTITISGLSAALVPISGGSLAELGMFNTAITPLVANALFSNGAQWSGGASPDSTDDVEINMTGVKVGAAPAYAGTLTIDHGFDLTVDNNGLTVGNKNGGFLSLSGALTINPSQTLTINHGKLTVGGTITNNGTVNINP